MRTLRTYVTLTLVIGACARPYPPPGGEQDRTPPRLAAVSPEALTVAPGFTGDAVFQFDERLSERGFSEALVVVSPLDGAIRVERGRREVRVTIDGGWRQNRVYRVVLLPGLRDLFGNARTEPVELVFSTGPPVPNTAIGGIIQDRLTARAAQNGIITALRRADSVSYMTTADSGGFFALRHLPFGVYELRAYADQNRNRRRDGAEPVDSGRVVSLGLDTLTELFTVLAADTTPARLRTAEALDSLHIRLSFDDYLDPATSFTDVGGQVFVLPDSTAYTLITEVFHPAVYEQQKPRPVAAVDTTPRQPGDTTRVLVQRPPVQRPPPPRDTTPPPILPTRDMIAVLSVPLRRGTEYVVTLPNVTNINGLRAGSGSARFQMREIPTVPTIRRDTLLLRLQR